MENKLASFEIVVTDEKWLDGERSVYKLGYDTMNICRKLHPSADVSDYYADRKANNDPQKADKFYKEIAVRLSGVNLKKLVEKFDAIRVNFKTNATEERYAFGV